MALKKYKLIRVEESVWLKIKAFSGAMKVPCGVTIDRLVDHAVLRAAPPLDYFNLLTELRHIGTNLNQLAARANTTHEISEADRIAYYENAQALKQLMIYMREVVEGD